MAEITSSIPAMKETSTVAEISLPSFASSSSSSPIPISAENTAPTIRNADKKDIKAIAATLLSAFKDDHVMRYFIDTPDASSDSEVTKLSRLSKLLELTTAFHISCGVVTTIGADYDSVALWLAPCADQSFRFAFFRSFWRLRYILTREGRYRFFKEFTPLLVKTKTVLLGVENESNCWYLVYLATKPTSQGRGYGRMLVEQMIADADQHGRHIYLESSNEANLRFYGKSGFVKKGEVYLERNESEKVALDVLIRKPNTALTE